MATPICKNSIYPSFEEKKEIKDSRTLDPKHILQSYANLQKFFQSSPDIERILIQKTNIENLKLKTNKLARINFEKRETFSIELNNLIDEINSPISTENSKRTILYEVRQMINQPNSLGQQVTRFASIPNRHITNPRVEKRCYLENWTMNFNHQDGICSGISEWIIFLFLKTQNCFPNTRIHLFAIGKLFKKGGGIDPTFLQSIMLRKGKILGLKIGVQPVHSNRKNPQPLMEKTIDAWNCTKNEIVNELKKLKLGLYRIDLPIHSVVYIKVNSALGFYIESNKAIIEIHGKLQGESLQKLINFSYLRTGNERIPFPKICVFPISLR